MSKENNGKIVFMPFYQEEKGKLKIPPIKGDKSVREFTGKGMTLEELKKLEAKGETMSISAPEANRSDYLKSKMAPGEIVIGEINREEDMEI